MKTGPILLFALAFAGLTTPALGSTPTDQLRHSIDDVLAVLSDSALKAPAKAAKREAALRQVIEARFDFDEMARRALGLYWRDPTPQERRQFTDLFRRLLERVYIARIESYSGEAVKFVGASDNGDFGTVEARIVTRRGTEIPVDYLVFRRGGQWLVYDVLIERISLIDNDRSQFRDIIDSSSYQQIIKRIEAKLHELDRSR